MTLAVEKQEGGSLWLVMLPSPNEPSVRLARFIDREAADLWKLTHDRSMLMAREVGRMGVG